MFIGWVGLFCIIVLARFLDCRRYMRAPQHRNLPRLGLALCHQCDGDGVSLGTDQMAILITPNPLITPS